MKFCDRSFLKRWLLSVRSFYALALLVIVVLMTGILRADAGEVQKECRAGRLEILVVDEKGERRLFREGTPVRLTQAYYFTFPEESYDRQIRIGDQAWQAVSGETYRLNWEALCNTKRTTLRIFFGAYDSRGQRLESSFFFYTGEQEADCYMGEQEADDVDTQNAK